MLSVGRCRQIVGDSVAATDDELQQLRDQIYEVARHAVRLFDARKEASSPNRGGALIEVSFSTLVTELPEVERYELEERAAIHEFDGKMSRADAEKEAARAYFWAREKK